MAQDEPHVVDQDDLPRVVIIGGGFGGLFAARMVGRAKAKVRLIDRGTSHLFQPLLYQCATGLLSSGQITVPLRSTLRKSKSVRTLCAEVTEVDPAACTVTAVRADGSRLTLPYNYLVVAVGMQQSYFGHPEFARFAPGMKTIDDALSVRRRVFSAFEMAELNRDPERRREWLTFAVVGAGPTGVELAGQIRELATHTIAKEFREIDPTEARVMMFDPAPKILGAFDPKLSSKAARILTGLGVEIRLGEMVTAVDETGLTTKSTDGTTTRYPVRTVLWTAGVEAVPLAHQLAKATGAEQDRAGRIKVEPDFTIPGHPNIWVLGDMMSLNNLPGVAEVALQGGLFVGNRIRLALKGTPAPQTPFKYRDVGNAAYLCRGHALVESGPLKLSGRLGWLMWAFIHILFLSGFRNRFATLLTWVVTLLRGDRRERALTHVDLTTGQRDYDPVRPAP